jgi:general secretion pathway protein B
MPPFKINVYAYSKSPAERFAIIDMSKYLAGDRIPGGALLLEIRADSLIFELDGTKFRVPRP